MIRTQRCKLSDKFPNLAMRLNANSKKQKLRKQMTIENAQKEVDNWIKENGIRYFNELTNMAILTEEVGEVARIIARKYGEQSFKKEDEKVNLADEFADVLFVLICLANQTGVDLTNALKNNLEKKSIRDKERHKNNPKLKKD
jgi:NTP pyrophosphatase (non-canonical NTP hydrolase)